MAKHRREEEKKMATDGKDSTWNWNQQFEIWNWAYYWMVNLTFPLQSTRNSIEITWKYNCEKSLYFNLTFLVAVLMWLFAWNTRIKCRPLVGYLIVSFCLFVCLSVRPPWFLPDSVLPWQSVCLFLFFSLSVWLYVWLSHGLSISPECVCLPVLSLLIQLPEVSLHSDHTSMVYG